MIGYEAESSNLSQNFQTIIIKRYYVCLRSPYLIDTSGDSSVEMLFEEKAVTGLKNFEKIVLFRLM